MATTARTHQEKVHSLLYEIVRMRQAQLFSMTDWVNIQKRAGVTFGMDSTRQKVYEGFAKLVSNKWVVSLHDLGVY